MGRIRLSKLQKIGNKCAVPSWYTYYDALSLYAQAKRDKDGFWDGNVIKRYETDDEPSLKLGQTMRSLSQKYIENRTSRETGADGM